MKMPRLLLIALVISMILPLFAIFYPVDEFLYTILLFISYILLGYIMISLVNNQKESGERNSIKDIFKKRWIFIFIVYMFFGIKIIFNFIGNPNADVFHLMVSGFVILIALNNLTAMKKKLKENPQ